MEEGLRLKSEAHGKSSQYACRKTQLASWRKDGAGDQQRYFGQKACSFKELRWVEYALEASLMLAIGGWIGPTFVTLPFQKESRQENITTQLEVLLRISRSFKSIYSVSFREFSHTRKTETTRGPGSRGSRLPEVTCPIS